MELTPGYKQTEMGVIPNEWEVKPLRDLKLEISDGNYSSKYPKSSDFRRIGVPFIRANNIKNITVIDDDMRFISKEQHQELKKGHLKANDILITTRGEIGQLALVPPSHVGSNINAQLVRINPASADVDHRFLAQAISEGKAQTQLTNLQTGSALKQLPVGRLVQLRLALPPLVEQRAIAIALSDVDALIAGLERLIAKKRDIKQAAMQQLLTGQTRLPGFSGSWRRTTFGNVVRHHSGNSELIKGKLPSSDAAGHYPGFSASGQDVWLDRYEHEGDAIVVSAVGSRCGKAFAASGKWSAIANTHVVWPDEKQIDRRFLGFFINDEDFWLKSGSGQPFVLFKQTFARQLQLPSLDEQKSISTMLFDIDHDLAAAESRLAKTRAIKQGMMQELLTGRTRLLEAK